MVSRSNLARVSSAVLGASVALLVAAVPAAADNTGTTATLNYHGDKFFGHVTLAGGETPTTALLGMTAKNGSPILAYCVQLTVHEAKDGSGMVQVPWTQYPDPTTSFKNDPAKINWILHNSYPSVDLATLSKTVDAPATLSEQQAVEGTQAAIWSLSDGAQLNMDAGKNDAAVDKLYTYLTTKATDLVQPKADPALTIEAPSSTTGAAGTKIGPFTVHTNLDVVNLLAQAPDGVKVKATDASGKTLANNAITDGAKVYFDVPATATPASGTFKLSSDVKIGQLFVGAPAAATAPSAQTAAAGGQSLIVAKSSSISASSSASWTAAVTPSSTAPPSTAPVAAQGGGQLANTGVSIALPISLAVVLIGAGAAFLLIQRRRARA